MERKAALQLLILFLGFSYVLSSRPLPPSAYLKSSNIEESSIQEFVEQGLMEWRNYGEGLDLEEAVIRGRMDIQSNNDYAAPGANHRHDPKTPPP